MAETLKDQLYEALKSSIEAGSLEPGLVLLESRIARLFTMSRSPVRDTLQRLFDEGLVSRFEGRGYLVGQSPEQVIRREIQSDEFKPGGGTSITREHSWYDLAAEVERDAVLCSMVGRWEINELQLANALGVSRAVTQQILLQLQYIGVVEREKYSGWNVVPLNDERLHQLYEARLLLEPFMVERATARIPSEILQGFLADLERVSRSYPNVEAHELDALEHDLHAKTLDYGGNQEILTMLGRTRPILLISKHLLGGYVELPSADPFLEEHSTVLNLMLEGRGKEAGEALKRHLQASEAKVRTRLAEYRQKEHVPSPEYLRWLSAE
ncbi:GntR family transcriptional regulator [Pokkaliibacter sp. CJK22405]|uniref:GntR family transcriptional regulator n=1 Tax=Pokkaliibacter sp. CJK22405 TaxID=3384615 RepID=UPI003985457D